MYLNDKSKINSRNSLHESILLKQGVLGKK